MNAYFYDIEQNTDEWLDLRSGLITSSQVGKVMSHLGKPFGEPAKSYAEDIALEQFTGVRIKKSNYVSSAMERGHELEPEARRLYELENFVEITNGGFFEDGNLGDSPDGLIGDDGVIEIKSVEPKAHWKRLKKGGFDSKYKWQIHFHLLVTGRKWCDFVSYCPDFPEDKQLYIYRVERDEEIIETMKERINEFEKLIKENIKILKK